jgi:hypothetical protein
MPRKKKFQFPFLEEALKPDVQFMVKDAEATFSRIAQQIFEGMTFEKEPAYDIKAIFKDKDRPKETTPADDDFLKLLAQAQAEATALAADIFK